MPNIPCVITNDEGVVRNWDVFRAWQTWQGSEVQGDGGGDGRGEHGSGGGGTAVAGHFVEQYRDLPVLTAGPPTTVGDFFDTSPYLKDWHLQQEAQTVLHDVASARNRPVLGKEPAPGVAAQGHPHPVNDSSHGGGTHGNGGQSQPHVCHHLMQDYQEKLPSFLGGEAQFDFLNALPDQDYRFCYVGKQGTRTGLHFDVLASYSWSANICGVKKWRFYCSECTCGRVSMATSSSTNVGTGTGGAGGREQCGEDHDGGSGGRALALCGVCCLNQHLLDAATRDVVSEDESPHVHDKIHGQGHGGTRMITVLEVLQQAGDLMFVPSCWPHTVENVTDAISINHNWVNAGSLRFLWQVLLVCVRVRMGVNGDAEVGGGLPCAVGIAPREALETPVCACLFNPPPPPRPPRARLTLPTPPSIVLTLHRRPCSTCGRVVVPQAVPCR